MNPDEVVRALLEIDPTHAVETERDMFLEFLSCLRRGELRAAEKRENAWISNTDVKKAILWGFRAGVLVNIQTPPFDRGYTDKDTLPVRIPTVEEGIRMVPGGSSIRDGSYVAPGVIVMPPSYINIGAYVDENTLVDSHVLIGSCAQVGKRVHLSAAVQIGGVLEPIGATPVVIEDDVMVGGNCGIYEGVVVRKRAVLGTGVILNASIPVYDLVNGTILRSAPGAPLEIPEGAVVVQGSRPARGSHAETWRVHLYTPVIVKYRDERTDAATALEESLR